MEPISIISIVFGILVGASGWLRTQKKDAGLDASTLAEIKAKLDMLLTRLDRFEDVCSRLAVCESKVARLEKSA